jgi:hypothetical protein
MAAVKRALVGWPNSLVLPLRAWTICACSLLLPLTASAAPSPEIAKQCLRAAYMLYPYKRPGAAPMTGDRLFFFKDCVAKHQAENSTDGQTDERLPSPPALDPPDPPSK